MPIVVSCECGGRFRARDELAGRRMKCPKCSRPLTIPNLPAPPEEFELSQPQYEDPQTSYTSSFAAPAPVPPAPSPSPAVSGNFSSSSTIRLRKWLYLALILTIIPLAWSTFHNSQESIEDRLRDTIKAHPESREGIVRLLDQPDVSEAELFDALPDHRFEGAFLPKDSHAQWIFAILAAAAFFGLALFMLPADTTRPLHVFFTGLFTGTAGVLLLLGVQLIAEMMRGRIIIPRSIAGIIFLILKGIQLSYDAANDPDSNFFLSALGFTFGVGLCEELCKALPLLWHYRRKATLDWRGACLWGFLSGVGFGISEAIMYAGRYNGIEGAEIYLVRFVSCVGLHGIWAAAAGIFIYKHQNLIQDAESWYHIFFNAVVLVCVPMVLHGFYDTMLKKEMNASALVVALLSFGWLIYQVESARRNEERVPAYA